MCGSYGPGHLVHWVQGKKSWEPGQSVINVTVTAVHDDGRVEFEGDDVKAIMWHHDPAHLRSVLNAGSRAEWRPRFHVLHVVSATSFCLATLDKVEPCVPPARRRPNETTRH